MFNTHVLLRDDGFTVARYRKVHLFELASEGLHESRTTVAGEEMVVVPDAPCGEEKEGRGRGKREREREKERRTFSNSTQPFSLSLSQKKKKKKTQRPARPVDLLRPPLPGALPAPPLRPRRARPRRARRLHADDGAGAGHWEVLLRARAVETQCAVVAAAQVGEHSSSSTNNESGKRSSWGEAMIIDASGKVLARMKSADEVEKEKKEKKEKGGGKENSDGDDEDEDDELVVGNHRRQP